MHHSLVAALLISTTVSIVVANDLVWVIERHGPCESFLFRLSADVPLELISSC